MKIIYQRLLYPLLALLLLLAFIWYAVFPHPYRTLHGQINIGILYSETGTMAGSELPILRAILLAIEEINDKGGVHGQRLVPIVYDGGSNWKRYAELAEKMVNNLHVNAIFGCWVSSARKGVREIVEKYDNLLIYPTQHEGLEESNNIVYLGATPNQQLTPGAGWMFGHHGKRVFLVGSDYIYPHVANEILKYETYLAHGEVVGERYIPLGNTDVEEIIAEVVQKKPDFIFNTINGSTNIAFFKRLHEVTQERGLSRPPVMSFSLSPADVTAIGPTKLTGDYASWSYYPAIINATNKHFLDAYAAKYGSTADVNEPAILAYAGVYLWAQAAAQTPNAEPRLVRNFLLGASIPSPEGVIYVDPGNAHAWKIVRIGQINQSGAYEVVWTSFSPVPPVLYPDFKTKAEWNLFEYKLFIKWGENWGANENHS